MARCAVQGGLVHYTHEAAEASYDFLAQHFSFSVRSVMAKLQRGFPNGSVE